MEAQLAALERELGKKRSAHAVEKARVDDAADDLENLKAALAAAQRSCRQQEASCTSARQAITKVLSWKRSRLQVCMLGMPQFSMQPFAAPCLWRFTMQMSCEVHPMQASSSRGMLIELQLAYAASRPSNALQAGTATAQTGTGHSIPEWQG